MAVPSSRFLDPRTLAALDDLELLARTVVEGYLSGQHLLPQAGFGVEFSQYRSYQPGDDLRRIDWRAYGRSDRFYVRESEVERDVTVRFVLDATGSMAHHDGSLAKIDYGRMLVAALAYLANRQGDRLQLHVVTRDGCADLRPGMKRPLARVLHHLDSLRAGGAWPSFEILQGHLITGRARELIIVVSDLYDRQGAMDATLRNLRALGHEVLVLQVMARNELELSWQGDLEFEDLESGQRVVGNTALLRQSYLESLQRELESWRQRLLELRVPHALMTTETPLEIALREFLIHRSDLPS
jgi:uncharacterized protein (DUF58 family)